ncbi:MAG: glycosyltransferase family 4 protein [Candidatus Rokubacteria bacterium]|nr:glycosyltransferase family 4 protein [Candidatus Rokubacteria bacterium]MBI3827157.1 glycosyltransferase family 4 protein [Candidatus Rokubacteria bacterium]
MPARVALLAPFAFPSVRGNAVTVDRVARGLRERSVDVATWDLSATPAAAVETEVDALRPSLVHAFHARRTGPLALRLARRAEVPLVVSLTGTDANRDLFDPEQAPVVRRVLEGAARVTAFHASIAERVAAALPDVGRRIVVVPQSVRLMTDAPFDLQARWPLPASRTLFVFPAGLRAVKRPRAPLGPLERLAARVPGLRLLYAGPALEPDEGDALLAALASRPWARHVGAVPHAQMASLLAQADVVLNCSESEGGMANSVLEALAMGRAVLASDIDGNRSLIEHGVTGLLFSDPASLEAGAARLATDPALRARLGAAGRALVQRRYPPSREIDGYLGVYRALVTVPTT